MGKSLEELIKEIRSDIEQTTQNDLWTFPQFEMKEKTYPEILFPPGPHSLGLESLKRKQREDMRRKKQQQLCEMMFMYQAYHKLLWLKQQNGYASRGSILVCQYGGVIRIVEVPGKTEEPDDVKEQDINLLYELSDSYIEWLYEAEGKLFSPIEMIKITTQQKQIKMLSYRRVSRLTGIKHIGKCWRIF